MAKEALESLISRLEFWALIFGVIVVIGVAGESVFGVRIWWNNRKLRKLQDDENVALQLKISEFQQKAEDAKRESAATNAKAEGFRLEIAKANERAAKSELDLEKLRKHVDWRSLTPKEIRDLSEHLRIFAPQQYLLLGYRPYSDLEIDDFLHGLDRALRGALWSSVGSAGGGYQIIGVRVFVLPTCTKQVRTAAGSLVSWLTAHGRASQVVDGKTKPDEEILKYMGDVFAAHSLNPNEGITIAVGPRP